MRHAISLEQLYIPEPCLADWETMAGNERTRFCETCHKHVVDLSAHTRAEAEAIVAAALPGGLCAQFRFDTGGRMVTVDSMPARRPWWRVGFAASALVTFVASVLGCKRPEAGVVAGHMRAPDTTQSVSLPGDVMIRGDVDVSPATRPSTMPTTRSMRTLGTPVMKLGEIARPATHPTP